MILKKLQTAVAVLGLALHVGADVARTVHVAEFERNRQSGIGIKVFGRAVAALSTALVKHFRAVSKVGHNVAAQVTQRSVVIIVSAHIVQEIGERVAHAPFRPDTEVLGHIEADADAKRDGKVAEGVHLALPLKTLSLRAEVLEGIIGAIEFGLRIERKEGNTGENIGREEVLAPFIVQFEKVELRLHRNLSDGRLETEVALVFLVGDGIAGGHFAEENIRLDGPSRRKIVTINDTSC